MLVYPQLPTGALSQFPIKKRRHLRTIVNTAADGSSVKLADAPSEHTQWTLEYTQLSDAELTSLQQFFAAAEGTLNAFTFLDPAANLLAWSDHLDNAVWVPGPLLTLTGGADPAGGTNAWHLNNPAAGAQNILQTISAPAGYLYCLSAYLKSAQAGAATLLLGTLRKTIAVNTNWTRFAFAGSGDPTQQSIGFGIEVPAGGAIDVYGMQVEPQAAPSVYKPSTTGGVYENARLFDDALTITSTDVNRHSCKVNIYYAKHL